MLTLPTEMDWNNLNCKKWTTELRDQNPDHKTPIPRTCVAFGALAVLETLLKIHYYNDPYRSLDLSEGNLWTCGHRWAAKGYPDVDCSKWRDDTEVKTEDAWTIEPPLRYLTKFGVPSGIDSIWPKICVCAGPSPNTKIKSFQMIPITGTGNADDWKVALKKKLVMYGPVIARYNLSQQYGTHCVAIVGYDDNLQRFLLKDSLDNENPFISYDGPIPSTYSIEVYKPHININIDGLTELSELSLKIVKIAPTNLGNLVDVDPTVLPNLQKNYSASYDRASGWLTISIESRNLPLVPLELAVPPGKYDIYMKISDHIYFGFADVGQTDAKNSVHITLREFTAPLYFIYVKHSEKYLEVRYAGQVPDVDVIQNGYQGGSHQMFRFVGPQSDGYYRIDAQCSGLCLDIRGNVSDDGARLIQYLDKEKNAHTENDLFNQRFKMEPISDDPGYFRIVVKVSGKYLSLNNDRVGARVFQNSLDENSLFQRFGRELVFL
jgi:hypothetical protein